MVKKNHANWDQISKHEPDYLCLNLDELLMNFRSEVLMLAQQLMLHLGNVG